MKPKPKTVLYARVSTSEQTSEHQLTAARNAGFVVEDQHVISDHGVSGVSTRLKDRDQGRRLYDLLQAGDTLAVRWIDRLGRNYEDVNEVITEFNKRGVTVETVINRMRFEADHLITDPTMKAARDAIKAFMSALAEADATAKREARENGIRHALASADAERKYRGKKPSYDRATFKTVQTLLDQDTYTISAIARETGLSRQAVLRIRDTPEVSEAALARWEQ